MRFTDGQTHKEKDSDSETEIGREKDRQTHSKRDRERERERVMRLADIITCMIGTMYTYINLLNIIAEEKKILIFGLLFK